MDWTMASFFSLIVIACVGGASTWIRFVIARAVKNNDLRHLEHDRRYDESRKRVQDIANDVHTLALKVGTEYLTRHEFRETTADQTRAIEMMFARVHERMDRSAKP